MLFADARFVLAVGDVEAPMARVLNSPMGPHGMREALHSHRETADEVSNVHRLLSVAQACQHGHSDGQQAFPAAGASQVLRHRHLNVMPDLLGPRPRVVRTWP